MGIYALPKCPECRHQLTVANFITDRLAECSNCGHSVTVEPTHATDHSPSAQKNVRKF